jgi:hypothetical protein
VSWILRLVKTGAEGEGQATDIMEIDRPDDLRDIASLGLTLSEAKQLVASLQQEIVAAQARTPAVLRPSCPCGRGVRHVKDYREHAIATLFVRSWCAFPDFVAPRVVRSRLELNGHYIADQHRNWTEFRRTSPP